MSYDDLGNVGSALPPLRDGAAPAAADAARLCVACLRTWSAAEARCPSCGVPTRPLPAGAAAEIQRARAAAHARALAAMTSGADLAGGNASGDGGGPDGTDAVAALMQAALGLGAPSADAATAAAGAPAGGGAPAAEPTAALAELLAALQLGGGAWGGGGADTFDPAHAPAAAAAVAALPRIRIADPARDLPRAWRLHVRVPAPPPRAAFVADFAVIPAAFSPPLAPAPGGGAGRVAGPLVAADPPSGAAEPLRNAAALAGAVALLDRGAVTFATKALRAAAAGAIAVVCVQSADVWPYVATDTAGELLLLQQQQQRGAPPFVMLRRQEGAALRAALASAPPGEAAAATLTAAAAADDCAVCLDGFGPGQTAALMPCGHYFHEACLVAGWLVRRTTCPLCRCALPAEGGGGAAAGPRALAAQAEHRRAVADSWYA